MSVWFYIGLAFVLINLFFIVLFFFARSTLYLQYKDGKFSYYAKICGIKTQISLRKRKHKHARKGKFISSFKPKDELSSLSNLLLELYEIRDALFATSGRFFKKARFEITKLNLVLGGANATETALIYGGATQAISYILEYLDNVARVDIPDDADFIVKADFVNQSYEFETNITVHVAFFRYVFWRYILLDLNYNDNKGDNHGIKAK